MKENVSMKGYIKTIYKALDDKKAEDIQIIDIHEVSYMADYFIIANGTNVNQVHALCDNVSEELAKLSLHAKQTEGYATGKWILMDYGDIIIHIFDCDIIIITMTQYKVFSWIQPCSEFRGQFIQ